MTKKLINILYVDDDPLDRELVRDVLEREDGGFQVIEAASRAEFETRLVESDYDLVLSDFNILGFQGLQVIDTVRAEKGPVPVVILTGTGSENVAVESIKRGAADYIVKNPEHIRRLPLTLRAVTTMHKQANEALYESEKRYQSLIQKVQTAIVLHDSNGRILAGNPMAQHLLGLSEDQLLGRELIDPKWHFLREDGSVMPVAEYPVSLVLTSQQPLRDYVAGICRPDREETTWVLVNAEPEHNDAGEIAQVIVSFIDLTERKLAEEKAKQLAAIVQSSDDAIFGKTLSGIITSWNRGAEKIYGYTESEMIGQPVSRLVPHTHTNDVPQILETIKAGNHIAHYETVRRHKDGRHLDISLAISPIRDSVGRVVAASTIARDITKRKRAEEEIYRLNQELEQRVRDRTNRLEAANEELEAFAYSVSHDLRAPLRHIDGFLQLLKKQTTGALNERSQYYMNTISDSAQRMGTLIDDLLTFSRMGRYAMSKTSVDLNVLAQEVIGEFAPETQDRLVNWHIADLPPVKGDRTMLYQVLVNLLSNALKFTRERASAEIEIGWQADEKETTIFVRDNGVGFDMAYVDKLFGVFHRLHREDEFEGTGIGLANVRRVINRHGGRTWAEGEVDQGATFYFSLPQYLQETS